MVELISARRLVAIIGAAALVVTFAAPMSAAKPLPLALGQGYTVQQSPVEQESPDFFFHENNAYYCTHDDSGALHPDTCVYNVTPCAWDVDDTNGVQGTGDVAANAVVSGSACVIADRFDSYGGDNHRVEVRVNAPTNGLSVRLSNSEGLLWTTRPVAQGNAFGWTICARDVTAGPYPIIEGSNGGTGRPITYTLTVTAGSRSVHDVLAVMQTGFSGIYSTGCP